MQRVADDPAKDDDFPLSDNLKNVFNVDWKEHPFSSSISYAEETTNQWFQDRLTFNIIQAPLQPVDSNNTTDIIITR